MFDLDTQQNHNAPLTTSDLLYKGAEFLREQAMTGLILRGARPDGPWLGQRKVDTVSGLVKEALDPDGRFPDI